MLARKPVGSGTVPTRWDSAGQLRLADGQLAHGNVVYEDLFAVLKGPQ